MVRLPQSCRKEPGGQPFNGYVPSPCRNPLWALGRRLLAGPLVLLASCSGEGSPGPDPEGAEFVSSPVTVPAGVPTPDTGPVVYVSAPPGSATGSVVTVANERTRAARSMRLTDGGFDPLSVGAVEGDRVVVSYDGQTGAGVLVRKRPPRVVRSSPGPNRTDVPLNARIEVVFSAPIAQGSVDDGVRLTRGSGELVPGEITLSADGLTLEILPSVLLDPETTYILELTTDLRDLAGGALQEAVAVPFTTGTTVAAPEPVEPWYLEMTPASCCPTGRYRHEGHLFGITLGETMVFRVLPLGKYAAVSVGTSNTDVADVMPDDQFLTVAGNSPGRVRISAAAEGVLQLTDLVVYGPLEVPVSSRYRVVGVDNRGRLASALPNGSMLRVLNDTITDVHSWGPMTRGRLVFSRESGDVLIRELDGRIVPAARSPTPARCVAASRDGAWVSWMADAVPGTAESWDIVVSRSGGAGQPRILKSGQPRTICPVWSPDGELVYWGAVNELRIIHPEGSNDRQFLVSTMGRLLMPSEWNWAADRRLVVENYSVRSSRADGAAQTNLHTYGAGGRISWSGDGAYFLAPQMGGVPSGGTSYPLRALVRADGLARVDLPTLSLTLREAGFVPW